MHCCVTGDQLDEESSCMNVVLAVRPLLAVPKSRLLATCQQHVLPWVDDPSNDNPRHRRTLTRRALHKMYYSTWCWVRAMYMHTIVQSCNRATVQPCNRATVQPCMLIRFLQKILLTNAGASHDQFTRYDHPHCGKRSRQRVYATYRPSCLGCPPPPPPRLPP